MKRSLKIITLSITAVLCFVMSIVIALGSNVALAESTFKINEGFSIRTTTPDGLRVVTTVANRIENATYGTLMLPESMCEDIELAFDQNGELNENILNIPTAQFNADGVSYNSVLVAEQVEGQDQAFPETFYNVPITVRGYCIDGETITYTENTVTRSMAFTAASAYVNGYENEIAEKIVGENKLAKEIVIDEVTVGASVSAKLFIGNIDASVSDKITVTFSGNNDQVATVSADGTVQGVKAGSVTITATVSGEGAETIVVEKEISISKQVITLSAKYDYGVKNDATLFIKSSDLTAVPVKATVGETEVEIEAVDGGYNVDGAQFTTTGEKTLTIETESAIENVKVNCVTAVLRDLTDLQSMATYATDNIASFVLANDIDCGGYQFGAGTTWANLNVDGRGYMVSNYTLAGSNGLFGNKILAGTIKNLAITGFSAGASQHYTGGICRTFGGATLENIYVSGSVPAGVAQTSLLVMTTDASSTFKNILVNVEDSQRSDASAITRISNAEMSGDEYNADYVVTNMTNVYSIDSSTTKKIKHVAVKYGTGTISYAELTSATGGYDSLDSFLADKDTIFTGDFTNTFTYEEEDNVAMIKFLGRPVQEWLLAEDNTIHYSFGYKNQDLVMPVSDFEEEVVSVKVLNGAQLQVTRDGDNYVISGDNFSATGTVTLMIKTQTKVYAKNVEVVTAILMTASDLDKMDDWGRPSTFDESKLGVSGTLYNYTGVFKLGQNIDYEGNLYTTEVYYGSNGYDGGAGARWKNLVFDGQGFAIKNIKFDNSQNTTKAMSCGLFGYEIQNSTIKNVAVLGVEIGSGAYTGVFGRIIKTSSTLENVFVQGSSDSTNNHAFTFYNLSDATCKMSNILVDVVSATSDTKLSAITVIGSSATDRLATITSYYAIGATKTVCYNNSAKTATVNMTDAKAGYTDGAAFLADKDSIFTGDFAKVFSLGTDGTNTTLLFMGRTVKTF